MYTGRATAPAGCGAACAGPDPRCRQRADRRRTDSARQRFARQYQVVRDHPRDTGTPFRKACHAFSLCSCSFMIEWCIDKIDDSSVDTLTGDLHDQDRSAGGHAGECTPALVTPLRR